MMIGIVIIVAIIIIGAVIASLVNNGNGGTPFSGTRLVVSKAAPYTSYESFGQPADGNKFVVVYMNFTNEYSSKVDLNPFYFSLLCSDNNLYTYSWKLDYVMSDFVPADSTAAIVLYFEIPVAVTPTRIVFDGVYSMYDCSSEIADHWTTTPVLGATAARLSNVSYSVVTNYNPYFPPDPGNCYIAVTVTITNLLTTNLDLNPYYFELSTSYGLVHDYSIWVDTPTLPDGIQPGTTITVTIGFEIGLSEEPTQLRFDNSSYFTTISF